MNKLELFNKLKDIVRNSRMLEASGELANRSS